MNTRQKISRRLLCLLLALAFTLSGQALASETGKLIGEEEGKISGLGLVTPYSYTAQNEERLFERALDGNRATFYQYVAWSSLAKDEIPEVTLLFNEENISDLWIRNGRQTSEEEYLAYARIRRLNVTVYTEDDEEYTWEYRLEDRYDPDTVSDTWSEGYQRITFPEAVEDVVRVDLWIKGWYRGEEESSQYKLCITDLFFLGEQDEEDDDDGESFYVENHSSEATQAPGRLMIQTTPPASQYTGKPDNQGNYGASYSNTPVPRPTATPVAESGITVRLKDRLSTRSGPGTNYTELGTYLSAGSQVRALSAAYDEANGIWWVQVEFTYGGEKRRAYTGLSRLSMQVSQVPVEFPVRRDALLARAVYAYYGPGYAYTLYAGRLPAGIMGDVWQVENGYALLDYYDEGARQQRRVWVPETALEESNG